ncbi:AtpZ/AtpI family protein [uncultured Anaeromusa sp.]|uniref:AtpZ/AtpI family protein n=1 Tax=uncultured Anaeromusa sp. TaxID=673273 RepID=UPI0029C73963|nr:AtpZ/AtpI family protein [uncultured Anaeromusa sp.]
MAKHTGEQGNSNKKWQLSVGKKAERKARSKCEKRLVWFGFGMFGLVGWSVALPALGGVALGLWLDEQYPRQYSWTLTLLLAGLVVGCINVWYWLGKERCKINNTKDEA